ncbi:hypothetical protein BB561_001605 [Smittium simulii]|uniref:ERCC1-like central domain-containing protein n=1 Tax=Smittium simulii TaxID=133385 RepID=A0A2T9YTT5_9FUNG|nr:hypothetical protein BB561_001605 [Smittium simulii]
MSDNSSSANTNTVYNETTSTTDHGQSTRVSSSSFQGGNVSGPSADKTNEHAESSTYRSTPRANLSSLVINPVQKDNPILRAIQNTTYHFDDIVPDFVVGKTSCAVYLSLRYHKLYPEYIYGRLDALQNNYDLRVLLVLVDITDYEQIIREITKATVYANITILLAWSIDEAGKYIETLKLYENKSPDIIKEKVESTHMAQIAKSLTQIRSVNKTDVLTLVSKYKL